MLRNCHNFSKPALESIAELVKTAFAKALHHMEWYVSFHTNVSLLPYPLVLCNKLPDVMKLSLYDCGKSVCKSGKKVQSSEKLFYSFRNLET